MDEQPNDFRIIFVKMAELEGQVPNEQEEVSHDEIREYDEIRALREIVMEVQSKPQVFFTTT